MHRKVLAGFHTGGGWVRSSTGPGNREISNREIYKLIIVENLWSAIFTI